MKRQWVILFLGLALCARASAQVDPAATYAVNSEKSKLQITVSKEGLFKAFGHDHLVSANAISGRVKFNEKVLEKSSIELTVKATSLTVIDPGESDTDRRQVQSTMAGKDVLDSEKYPEIWFTSTGVKKGKKTEEGPEIILEGRLTLHGVEKPISLPVSLTTKDGEIRAEGEASLLQTDFGITPIKVGGGAVKVKNKVRIRFDVVADKLLP
jgi:polyisoprenoid-binding protein YceI